MAVRQCPREVPGPERSLHAAPGVQRRETAASLLGHAEPAWLMVWDYSRRAFHSSRLWSPPAGARLTDADARAIRAMRAAEIERARYRPEPVVFGRSPGLGASRPYAIVFWTAAARCWPASLAPVPLGPRRPHVAQPCSSRDPG